MADQSLQAFQLGASLYDRAQTQKRMMEQFNLQLADQAMRKEHYDIQNKIATDNAKRTLDEQNAFNQDLPFIQDWQSKFLKWNAAGNPNAPFPIPPTNLKSATGLKMLGDMSGPVLQSLPMMQNRWYAKQAYDDQLNALNEDVKILRANGQFDLVNQYNAGVGQDGKINPEAAKAFQAAALPFKQEEEALKNLPQELKVELLQVSKDGKPLAERIKIASENLEARKSKQPTAVIRNANALVESRSRLAELSGRPLSEQQKQQLKSNAMDAGGKLKPLDVQDAKNLSGDFSTLESTDYLLGKISDFEKQNNVNFSDYIGIIPANVDKIKSRLSEEKDPKKREAIGILADFYGILNNVSRLTSGLTVTADERSRIENRIGSTFDKNSLIKLKSYRDETERKMRGLIQRNLLDRDLPSFAEAYVSTKFGTPVYSLYPEYGISGGQQEQPSANQPQPPSGFSLQTTNAPVLPAGWNFKQ
jgi:hypothetical protein